MSGKWDGLRLQTHLEERNWRGYWVGEVVDTDGSIIFKYAWMRAEMDLAEFIDTVISEFFARSTGRRCPR